MRKVDITKKEMIAHLESFKPASVVGVNGNPQDCVVARMVKKVYKASAVFVSEGGIEYSFKGEKGNTGGSYDNPMWLQNFIIAMDAIPTKFIRAEQALTFFKK